ncbi:DUF305 domain-containing protein [Agromyces ramosus]|uniref:Uncharacterized protein (DUF305 family) n=1 Tax=Agromyces ramosus TaxID=33879 RepID=A0ABU0R3J0_9MICO|nr:DUF305 domain-containing protein [Agromyces ramosus]MDQ0892653.1 uncharacterized protein (DUF305 family) [Agromyces ramosus]
MRTVRRRPTAATAALIAMVGLSITACTAVPDPAPPTAALVTPSAPPGAESARSPASGRAYTQEAIAADFAFVAAMVVHHEQAVELAELAVGRAADPEIVSLAERMSLAQAAEASTMRSWLERRQATGESHEHGAAMEGEISRATLDRAAQVRGATFDRLFIAAMVPHHLGAVRMAEDRLAEPGDPAVARWARAMAEGQSLEVDRLREIEARLPRA